MDKRYWWSSSSGRIELQIPGEAIEECSHSGRCDDDVEYWAPLLGLGFVERKLIERELNEYGAWDDLGTIDIDTLHQRLCWVACCDLSDTPYDELEEVTK